MYTTFLINLDTDTDRLAYMDEQLQSRSIPYRRQSAIHGKTYTPTKEEYDEYLAVKKGGHALLPGEIGCALSHAAVISTIVAEEIPYALVLEDDVALPKNFKEIIEAEIAKNTKRNWEYLSFDYPAVGPTYIRRWFLGVRENFVSVKQAGDLFNTLTFVLYTALKGCYVIPLSLFEGIREWYKRDRPGPVRFFRPVYFAGAYLVTLSGAKKLQVLTRPVVYTADHLPNRARTLCSLRFRGYAPQIVHQRKRTFGSSILDLDGSQI